MLAIWNGSHGKPRTYTEEEEQYFADLVKKHGHCLLKWYNCFGDLNGNITKQIKLEDYICDKAEQRFQEAFRERRKKFGFPVDDQTYFTGNNLPHRNYKSIKLKYPYPTDDISLVVSKFHLGRIPDVSGNLIEFIGSKLLMETTCSNVTEVKLIDSEKILIPEIDLEFEYYLDEEYKSEIDLVIPFIHPNGTKMNITYHGGLIKISKEL